MIDALFSGTFGTPTTTSYEAEIKRAVERVVVDRVIRLASTASMPQVRAVASMRLERKLAELFDAVGRAGEANAAHYTLMARDIDRFLGRPAQEFSQPNTQEAPPGAPIGEPAMEWLRRLEPGCSWRN